jgi:hypothetical protein
VTGTRHLARLTGAALAVAVAAVPVPAAAEDELPAGNLGIIGGIRNGQGRLGENYTLGFMWGVQAAYHPTNLEQKWSFGAAWSLLWGHLWADDPTVADGSLKILEMNLALRVRRLMSPTDPVYLMLSPLGVTVLRTNLPVPPDGRRLNLGPYAGVGGEMFVGKLVMSLETRYGVFTGGPGSLTVLLCLSVGSR